LKYLLDTNVLSEIRKPRGSRRVKAFVGNIREEDLFISALSIGEIAYGVEKLSPEPKKHELLIWLVQKLPERFENRIVNLDRDVLEEWGRIQAAAGRTLPAFDSLIAASALARRLTVVTRNVKDFEGIEGLALFNPWEETAAA
jgi:predicted nucleic acid-binding protein